MGCNLEVNVVLGVYVRGCSSVIGMWVGLICSGMCCWGLLDFGGCFRRISYGYGLYDCGDCGVFCERL